MGVLYPHYIPHWALTHFHSSLVQWVQTRGRLARLPKSSSPVHVKQRTIPWFQIRGFIPYIHHGLWMFMGGISFLREGVMSPHGKTPASETPTSSSRSWGGLESGRGRCDGSPPVLTRSHGKSIIYRGFSRKIHHLQKLFMVFPSYEPWFRHGISPRSPPDAWGEHGMRKATTRGAFRRRNGSDRWSVASGGLVFCWKIQHFQWENPRFWLGHGFNSFL